MAMKKKDRTVPENELPQQIAIGEEEVRSGPGPVVRRLIAIGAVLALAAALVLAYLFLLVGEPEEEIKHVPKTPETPVAGPMSPMSALGDTGLHAMPEAFGAPVLTIYAGASAQKSAMADTAFAGGYARTAAITYTLEDGTEIRAVSLRPASAVTLLEEKGTYSLDGERLYTLAGLNAARMENGTDSVIFTQSEEAVYAVIFPAEKLDEVSQVLRGTTLLTAQEE